LYILSQIFTKLSQLYLWKTTDMKGAAGVSLRAEFEASVLHSHLKGANLACRSLLLMMIGEMEGS